MRKLVYYVGMSIDGFVAGPEHQLDFFPVTEDVLAFIREEYPETLPTHARAQLGVDAPNRRFDTGIQGRTTYQAALDAGITSPYDHLRQFVASRTLDPGVDPAVTVVAGDPVATVRELKCRPGLDIWLLGGAALAGSLLPEIDELVLKVYPVVVGDGVPLFRTGFAPTSFALTGTRTLPSGAVILTYDRRR